MKDLVLQIFSSKCGELHLQYVEKIKMLDDDPANLPNFAKHVELTAVIKADGKLMKERSREVDIMFTTLEEYGVKIPAQDGVAYDDLKGAVQEFADQTTASATRIEEKMMGMRQTVYKNILRLNGELEQQKAQLDQGVFIGEATKPSVAVKALDTMKASIDDITQQTVTLQGYQTLFGVDPYEFQSLKDTTAAYDKKREFWILYQTWLEKTKIWKETDFLTLDVELMNKEVQESFLKAHKLNKEFDESAVSAKVKSLIVEWKDVMPMIMDLGNKAIKQQHWKQLFTTLGHTFHPNDKIRLKKLRSLNIFASKDLISSITEAAVGEFALETSLEKVKSNWAVQEFIVAPYARAKDCYILGDVEETMMQLEDNQVSLQTMLASRYIAAVQEEVISHTTRISSTLLHRCHDHKCKCAFRIRPSNFVTNTISFCLIIAT
jgi:dynein heavy chain